jgi:hypothetical protein
MLQLSLQLAVIVVGGWAAIARKLGLSAAVGQRKAKPLSEVGGRGAAGES